MAYSKGTPTQRMALTATQLSCRPVCRRQKALLRPDGSPGTPASGLAELFAIYAS
jgi:hypothetical protein